MDDRERAAALHMHASTPASPPRSLMGMLTVVHLCSPTRTKRPGNSPGTAAAGIPTVLQPGPTLVFPIYAASACCASMATSPRSSHEHTRAAAAANPHSLDHAHHDDLHGHHYDDDDELKTAEARGLNSKKQHVQQQQNQQQRHPEKELELEVLPLPRNAVPVGRGFSSCSYAFAVAGKGDRAGGEEQGALTVFLEHGFERKRPAQAAVNALNHQVNSDASV